MASSSGTGISGAAPIGRSLPTLHDEIRARFGVLPNFFRLAPESPEITANLWGFARFAYLDNPLPSLFKERLFVYLSRFCDARYCIIRHVGFLTGRGYPAGDSRAPTQTIGDVLKLLRDPLPRGAAIRSLVARCEALDAPLAELPAPGSALEQAIFACAAHVFLLSRESKDCLAALKSAFGVVRFEQLMVLLTFVRAAHYWSTIHDDLVPEHDVEELLATQKELAEYLKHDPEAGAGEVSKKLEEELETLRLDKEHHTQLSRAYAQAIEVEEQLTRSNAELSAHLEEAELARSSALEVMEEAIRAKQSLWNSEQRLREADRRKDEFLATLAHELRNPLAPILSSVQIMRLPGAGGEVVEQARKTIERQVTHLVRLVDDLMDISRISRDAFELRRDRVSLEAVLQAAVETSRPVFDAARQQLSVTLPSNPVWLDADVTRLAQAVSNLLNNASRYSPDGADVELAGEVAGYEAVIRVRDNGIGIAAEVLPHIFEMFRQGNASDGRTRSGLGIGLTLVKRLVEMHGGTVEANSAGPGQGSEFVLRLPFIDRPPDAPPTVASEPVEMHVRRILIADDNRDAAVSLATLLTHSGHHTRVAHDGLEALEAAERFRPDAILLDIGMPELDGYEVARHIRNRDWGRDILLVALTGWGQDEDRAKSRDAGFDRHFVKPVDYAAIIELLGAHHR